MVHGVRAACTSLAFVLVAITSFQPHWSPANGHEPLPVHIDEHNHWGAARAVQRTGDAQVEDPFGAGSTGFDTDEQGGLAYPTAIHERGYHAYLAAWQATSGIPWVVLLEWTPVVVALFTALCVFILAERWNAGPETVLWLAAIPTTLRFLGPGFAVPIMLAIPLLVSAFWLLVTFDDWRGRTFVAILAAALWPIHAMGALLLCILVLLYALVSSNRQHAALAVGVVAVPFALAWPYYLAAFAAPEPSRAILPASLDQLRLPGALFFVAAAVGASWLSSREEKRVRGIGAALAMALVGALVLMLLRATSGRDPFDLYDRTVTTGLIVAAILAGAGARGMRESVTRAAARAPRAVAWTLVALLVVGQASLVAAAAARSAQQPFYDILPEERLEHYKTAAWALDGQRHVALIDGPDTMAWTAVTDIPTAYVATAMQSSLPPGVEAFFAAGAKDNAFLVDHGVTLVVTERAVSNPSLSPVAPGVYALDPQYAQRIYP